MNDERITELLSLADARVASPVGADPTLAERAILRGQRRTRLRRIGVGVLALDAVAAMILVAVWLAPTRTDDTPMTASMPSAATSHELAELDRERDKLNARIAMQEQVVHALLTTRNPTDARIPEAADPLAGIRQQIDLAARRMVLAADRIERDTGPSDFTRGLYDDVVTNFPDSAWASIARRRIDETQTLTEPRSAI